MSPRRHCVRRACVRLRRRAPRHVPQHGAARTSSERSIEGRGEAHHGPHCHTRRAGAGTARRLGEERVRHGQRRIQAGHPARVILLDRALAQYKEPETKGHPRIASRRLCPPHESKSTFSQRRLAALLELASTQGPAALEGFARRGSAARSRPTDAQRALQSRALGNHRFGGAGAMDGDRRAGKRGPDAVSRRARPLAAPRCSTSFGLFAPRNAIAVAVLFLGALSLAGERSS